MGILLYHPTFLHGKLSAYNQRCYTAGEGRGRYDALAGNPYDPLRWHSQMISYGPSGRLAFILGYYENYPTREAQNG